jgi:hypothetical protein
MGESLREVAQHATGGKLLRVQTELIGAFAWHLEATPRVLRAARARKRRDQPERADSERAFATGETVVGFGRVVARHEPLVGLDLL